MAMRGTTNRGTVNKIGKPKASKKSQSSGTKPPATGQYLSNFSSVLGLIDKFDRDAVAKDIVVIPIYRVILLETDLRPEGLQLKLPGYESNRNKELFERQLRSSANPQNKVRNLAGNHAPETADHFGGIWERQLINK